MIPGFFGVLFSLGADRSDPLFSLSSLIAPQPPGLPISTLQAPRAPSPVPVMLDSPRAEGPGTSDFERLIRRETVWKEVATCSACIASFSPVNLFGCRAVAQLFHAALCSMPPPHVLAMSRAGTFSSAFRQFQWFDGYDGTLGIPLRDVPLFSKFSGCRLSRRFWEPRSVWKRFLSFRFA